MKLGEKIKQIRDDNGWSQDSICDLAKISQSTLSGIEHDKWNPPETTVRDLADALERSFDTLIEGTDWKSDDKKNVSGSYAISPSEVKVTINDNGGWHYHNLSYPIKDSDGGDNKFSPTTGQALIYECEDCKRPINKPENKYCMGCGKNLIPDLQVFDDTKEMMSNIPYMTDPRAAESCLSQLTSLSSYYNDLIRRVKLFRGLRKTAMDEKEIKKIEKVAKSTGISFDIKSDVYQNILGIFNDLSKINLHVTDYGEDFSKMDIEPIIKTLEFNISIVEGLAKNMYVFMQKNSSAKSFEAIRLELYGRLADKIDDVSNSLAIDLGRDPALEKLRGIDEQTLANRVKEKAEALNQLKEILQTFDDVNDESYKEIDNLISKTSTLTDEKISNDLDEEKSRSNEKEDNSSIEDEKSSKPNKKGA